MRIRVQSTMAIRALFLGGIVVFSALTLVGCKAENAERATQAESEAATPAEVADGCREGANKMFATDEAAQAEKFARCMAKHLGEDWLEKNPELKPVE